MSGAHAFLDESGDESSKLTRGASRVYVVGLVLFPSGEEASACRERIDALRAERGLPSRYEFHFRKNSDLVRRAFLAAVASFSFTYHAVTIEKQDGPQGNLELYLPACARACELAGEALNQALLFVDDGASRVPAEIKKRVNQTANRRVLNDATAQRSSANNLIQVADYVAGIRAALAEHKPGAEEYRRMIERREGRFDRWRVP